MKRKEKQVKFHESLVNMLYAPPSLPPNENEFDPQTLDLAREIANSDHHPINTDELGEEDETNFSTSSDEEDKSGSEKLSRAQRKRLRKKKLKESGSNRRPIIGPELPSTSDDRIDGEGSDVHEHQQSECVRRNVAQKPKSGNDHNNRQEIPSSIKVKHRRLKKKARDNPKTPPMDLSHEATSSGDQK